MKRFLVCILSVFLLLCSCADAEFYESSSGDSESGDGSADTESAGKPQYMYVIMNADFQLATVRGARETICRVNLETGEALPLCFEPTCDHGAPWCTATDITYFVATDDGKKVYFWKANSGQGYLQQPGTGKAELILYELDTATLTLKEIDRCESTNYNWNLLAFDDGLVYNKYVVTETDEFGQTLSYTNSYYKLQPDGSKKTLMLPEELNIFFRSNQVAQSASASGYVLYDSEMNRIGEVTGEGVEGTFALIRAQNEAFSTVWDRSDPNKTLLYSYVKKENGTYESCLLSEKTDNVAVLQDYILLQESGGDGYGTVTVAGSEYSRALFTVHCVDPYTGDIVRSVDMTDRFASFGVENVTNFYPAPGKRDQMRIGNYQMFLAYGEDTLCGLPYVPLLFNAETGDVKRIVIPEA